MINAVNTGIKKLEKYFPRRLNNLSIKTYKAYILSFIVDARFKTTHFKRDGLLYFYPTIERDIIRLFEVEFNQ